MNELNLFPEETILGTKVLLVNFGGNEEIRSLHFLAQLQQASISAELYPSPEKMKKQFAYADSKKIPFTLIIGSEESASGYYQLKNMLTGEQGKYTPEEIIEKLRNKL